MAGEPADRPETALDLCDEGAAVPCDGRCGKDCTVICLGSNVADRLIRLHDALARLRQWCDVECVSEFYETADDSGLGAPYANVVLSCVPSVGKEELGERLKELERDFGRSATSKADGVMPLDADIVVWRGEIVDPYEFTRPYFRQGFDSLGRG